MEQQTYQITIREAVSEQDIATFWEQLHVYHKRDIFPNPGDEDLPYFLSEEYCAQIRSLHDRFDDRCRYLFFSRNGADIGFALATIHNTEDDKCFILEFCVYPEYRGNGTGKQCALALLDHARSLGAAYAELNCGNRQRARFWQSLGFIPNGLDEWGEPLMLLPPQADIPYSVEILQKPEDWQLLKLENSFLAEIGEEAMSESRKSALQNAIRDGKITFFLAKRGSRAVGMCSVAKCFSTFTCRDVGVFDDFFVEPAFRRKGIARMLTQAAQDWSLRQGLASLTVCCAPCDEAMYQHLGFDTALGSTYAKVN